MAAWVDCCWYRPLPPRPPEERQDSPRRLNQSIHAGPYPGLVWAVAAVLGANGRHRGENLNPAAVGGEIRVRIGFDEAAPDRKSTRLNSSHLGISYAVF